MRRTSGAAIADAEDDSSGNGENQESKRRRREPQAGEEEEEEEEKGEVLRGTWNVALFFGYTGSAHHGVDTILASKTVKGILGEAIEMADGISEHSLWFHLNYNWSWAARTEAGVAAVAQCISLPLTCEVDGKPDERLIPAINERLPDGIRCFGFTKTTAYFRARKFCDRRLYEYLIPLRLLGGPNSPLEPENEEEDNKDEKIDGSHPPREKEELSTEQEQSGSSDRQSAAEQNSDQRRRPYLQMATCRDPRVIKLNRILAQYEGTQSFHNFTDSPPVGTDAAKGELDSVRAKGPFRIGSVYYISVHILGKSFLKRQIRKMIGLALHVFHGHCPPETLELALCEEARFSTPTAPATGLVLNTLCFDSYNVGCSWRLDDPVTAERWRDQMDKFKRQQVYRCIARAESVNGTMARWLKKSVASANYERESILAQWNQVGEHNPQSPAGIRRARFYQRWTFVDTVEQVQLSQSEVDHMQSLFVRAFSPKVANDKPEFEPTDDLRYDRIRRSQKGALNERALTKRADSLVCVPHGLFLLGPPPHREVSALGLATRPYLMLAVSPVCGFEKNYRVTVVDGRLSQPVLFRPTGLRMQTMTEEPAFTRYARALATTWKTLATAASNSFFVSRSLQMVVRAPPEGPTTPQIADLLAVLLAGVREDWCRAFKQELAYLAARIFCERERGGKQGLEGFLACFAMCPDRQGLARYDPHRPKEAAALHPLAPSTRFFFVADAAPVAPTNSLPPLNADLQNLASLLARDLLPESTIDALIGCAAGEATRLCQEFEKLGGPFASHARAVRTEADCLNVRSILRYVSATRMLTSAHPRPLTAKDVGSAMTRVHAGEAERASEKDELYTWCLNNGAAGARRVGEDEMVKKESGILCVVDEEEAEDFKEKAQKKWGSNSVRALDVVSGGFVLDCREEDPASARTSYCGLCAGQEKLNIRKLVWDIPFSSDLKV